MEELPSGLSTRLNYFEFGPPSREEYGASEYATESNWFTCDFRHGPDTASGLEPARAC